MIRAQGDPAPRIAWNLEEKFFPEWCRMVQRTGDMLAIIDESHDVLGHRFVDPKCMKLVRRTRHSRVELLVIAQRPAGINISIRSQAHKIVSFEMSEAEDLKWIGGHCGAWMKEQLPLLTQGNSVEWRAGEATRAQQRASAGRKKRR